MGLASFYAELTGWQTVRNVDGWTTLRAGDGQEVAFQQVTEHMTRVSRNASPVGRPFHDQEDSWS